MEFSIRLVLSIVIGIALALILGFMIGSRVTGAEVFITGALP